MVRNCWLKRERIKLKDVKRCRVKDVNEEEEIGEDKTGVNNKKKTKRC